MKVIFRFKRFWAFSAFALLAVGVCSIRLALLRTVRAASAGIVVSQVYGGGGNSGASLKNDFIELFNPSGATIDISNWSVQYAAATGTNWQVTNLCAPGNTCTIAPGHYYLVQQAQGAGGTTDLPTPDATGVVSMSATAGKIALVNTQSALSGSCPLGSSVIDFVGYGSANCFEGTSPTNTPSNTTAVLRINSGCTDTDNNNSDFATGSPAPRNSASPGTTCGVTPSPTPTPSVTPTPDCGVERWSVKTGTDPDAPGISFISQPTTIATMRSWTPPSPIPLNNRVSPYETTVWTMNATLLEYKFEDDSDYHLVLRDESGNTLIAEIPHPGCVGAGSPFAAAITNARMKFNAMFTASTSFQFANVPVQITGVGMFDFLHGQTGVAPNGIELHPVLDINLTSTPNIQLSASSYTVNESAGAATVTVTRSDANTAASVDYATSDSGAANNCNLANGAASSRCDYLTTLGTLHFAANETSKTISIPIIDDAYAEGSETFTIALSNPANAVLATPASATITISDNETANHANPVDTTSFFVRQHYLDFLNREPDTSGFDFWSNQITSCGTDQQCSEVRRINVSASFFLSIEFQETGFLVERLYKSSYNDVTGTSKFPADHQLMVPVIRLNEFLKDTQEIGEGVIVGQGNWQQQLETNKQAFIAAFVQRDRFVAAFPVSRTPDEFVNQLFANSGVTPTAAERTAAIDEFGSAGTSADPAARARALRRVVDNAIYIQTESNRAFVLMQYFGYLRRNPNDPQDSDYTGYDFWLTKLNQFKGNYLDAEMVKAFISSIEYRQRFGP